MKVLLLIVLLIPAMSFATGDHLESIEMCKNFQTYKDNGWVIHKPSKFNSLLTKYKKIIDLGIRNGSVIEDLSGTTRTFNTRGGKPVLMAVQTYDSLKTDRDLMYGDFAVMVNWRSPEQSLEIRWFDGKKKHVSINPNYMSCISTGLPFAVNTIF